MARVEGASGEFHLVTEVTVAGVARLSSPIAATDLVNARFTNP